MFIKCHCNALDQFHVVSPGQYSPFSEGFVNLIISFEETIKNHWTPIKGENVSENTYDSKTSSPENIETNDEINVTTSINNMQQTDTSLETHSCNKSQACITKNYDLSSGTESEISNYSNKPIAHYRNILLYKLGVT
jgi:hypothetical protein